MQAGGNSLKKPHTDSKAIQIECRATRDLILFQHIRKLMTGLLVNDEKFGGSSLIEPTGSQKEKITNNGAFSKTVLLIDDDPDVTTVFGLGLQDEGFEVYVYNDPLEALSQFRPNFYDLLLIDINMPKMNGIDLSIRLLELDTNVKLCFITAGDANIEVLRELYPTRSIGCYIKKPVTIDQLVRRIKAELE
jgi:CheY-like chemotaxis protein